MKQRDRGLLVLPPSLGTTCRLVNCILYPAMTSLFLRPSTLPDRFAAYRGPYSHVPEPCCKYIQAHDFCPHGRVSCVSIIIGANGRRPRHRQQDRAAQRSTVHTFPLSRVKASQKPARMHNPRRKRSERGTALPGVLQLSVLAAMYSLAWIPFTIPRVFPRSAGRDLRSEYSYHKV